MGFFLPRANISAVRYLHSLHIHYSIYLTIWYQNKKCTPDTDPKDHIRSSMYLVIIGVVEITYFPPIVLPVFTLFWTFLAFWRDSWQFCPVLLSFLSQLTTKWRTWLGARSLDHEGHLIDRSRKLKGSGDLPVFSSTSEIFPALDGVAITSAFCYDLILGDSGFWRSLLYWKGDKVWRNLECSLMLPRVCHLCIAHYDCCVCCETQKSRRVPFRGKVWTLMLSL